MAIRHVVKEGEGTTSLSEQFGFFDHTVWSHADNEDLRARRSDMNALLPGDTLVIPDKAQKEASCASGASHQFKRKGIPAKYRVQLVARGKPLANRAFALRIDDAFTIEGSSDADGVVETYLPAGAKRGVLAVDCDPDRPLVLAIHFGRVGPIEEIAGVQKRLANLGYDCGKLDGTLNDQTRTALRLFQRRQELPETGEIDGATRDRLTELHDRRGTSGPGKAPL